MDQELCLPSSHFLYRHLFLLSGEEPCDHFLRQENQHRLAALARRVTHHLLLNDDEADKEMLERTKGYLERGMTGSSKKPALAFYAPLPEKNNARYYTSDPTLARQQLQAAHFQHLKRLQAMKQHSRERQSRNGRPLDLPPFAWPPLQKRPSPLPQHQGGGMLLGNSGWRKEPIGTGVFLPRIPGTKFEPREKSACSTELVPQSICQASNLNLSIIPDDDLITRRNAMLHIHENKRHPTSSSELSLQQQLHQMQQLQRMSLDLPKNGHTD